MSRITPNSSFPGPRRGFDAPQTQKEARALYKQLKTNTLELTPSCCGSSGLPAEPTLKLIVEQMDLPKLKGLKLEIGQITEPKYAEKLGALKRLVNSELLTLDNGPSRGSSIPLGRQAVQSYAPAPLDLPMPSEQPAKNTVSNPCTVHLPSTPVVQIKPEERLISELSPNISSIESMQENEAAISKFLGGMEFDTAKTAIVDILQTLNVLDSAAPSQPEQRQIRNLKFAVLECIDQMAPELMPDIHTIRLFDYTAVRTRSVPPFPGFKDKRGRADRPEVTINGRQFHLVNTVPGSHEAELGKGSFGRVRKAISSEPLPFTDGFEMVEWANKKLEVNNWMSLKETYREVLFEEGITDCPYSVKMEGIFQYGDGQHRRIGLIMDLLPTDMAKQANTSGYLLSDTYFNHVAQAVDGLKWFHDHGLAFLDYKQPNILIDQTGVAKLSDYGLCMAENAEDPTLLGISARQVGGTFFDPECRYVHCAETAQEAVNINAERAAEARSKGRGAPPKVSVVTGVDIRAETTGEAYQRLDASKVDSWAVGCQLLMGIGGTKEVYSYVNDYREDIDSHDPAKRDSAWESIDRFHVQAEERITEFARDGDEAKKVLADLISGCLEMDASTRFDMAKIQQVLARFRKDQ
ncbi:MAG: serine/threonine protein kinase [Candidatus Marinamargulisbacteria bacterium]|jgi:serine/threonine protein kinase